MPAKHIPAVVPPGYKYCFQCASVKPVDAFNRRSAAPDGRDPSCKPCKKLQKARSERKNAAMNEALDNTHKLAAEPEPLLDRAQDEVSLELAQGAHSVSWRKPDRHPYGNLPNVRNAELAVRFGPKLRRST